MNKINDNRRARVGITEPFVVVCDGKSEYFGGRQEWYDADFRPKLHKYGCGIVAAVNTYLYLAGITRVTKIGYMSLVDEFIRMYPLSRLCLNTGLGVLPWQMTGYIKRKCQAAGLEVITDWKGRSGIRRQYERMKKSLSQGIPVIWAFFNLKLSDKIQFYKLVDGEFKDTYVEARTNAERKYDVVNSHYVTATAIIEREIDGKMQRWVEISSWGDRYYVNYDEYETFVKNAGGFLNPVNFINGYCSNILIVRKK